MQTIVALFSLTFFALGTLLSSPGCTQNISIGLEPLNLPVQIPPTGGSFDFNISVTNPESGAQTFDVWILMQLPDSTWSDPLQGPVRLRLPAAGTIARLRSQVISGNSPPGVYRYEARAGGYPDTVWTDDGFQFSKLIEPPEVLWTQTFGGSGSDHCLRVLQTSGGGFVIVGYLNSFGAGQNDVYLIKTDEWGNLEWQQTYGGTENDYAYDLQPTSDGGYLIVGSTYSFGAGNKDVYLIKTNASGDLQWQQTYGGSNKDWGYSLLKTEDGGYLLAGGTSSYGIGQQDVYLIKTDSLGNQTWQQTFGGSQDDQAYSVAQTTDGGFIVTGQTFVTGTGDVDVYLIKTDEIGNLQWQQSFAGLGYDVGYRVQQTPEGGYIIVGYSAPYNPDSADIYVIKTDSGGNQLWQQNFGGSGHDYGYDIHQTSDGQYVIVGGVSNLGAGSFDVYLFKINGSGNVLWQQTVGGSGSDVGYSFQQTSDGGYVIAAKTNSFGAGNFDVYLIRLAPDTVGNPSVVFPQADAKMTFSPGSLLCHNFPNPFNLQTLLNYTLPVASHVNLLVYDITGRLTTTLVSGWRETGPQEVTFEGKDLPSGIYFYHLEASSFSSGPNDHYTASGKMILVK